MSKDAGTTTNDPQNHPGDMNGAISLERKLELLEKRFITPAAGRGTSTPPGRPEAATFLADTTSNLSSHSFSFTTPQSQSLSRPASVDSSNLPHHAVRSRRRPSLSSSLHAVQRATERHLRKVAASSPVGGMSSNNDSNAMPSMLFLQDANRSLSALPPSTSSSNSRAASPSSLSNQTLLINNRQKQQKQQQQQQQQRVVAESPPVIVSPHGAAPPVASSAPSIPLKPAAARNLLMTSTTTSTPATATASNPAPTQVCNVLTGSNE